MIGVLTHHWAKADKIDEARELLDRNGEAQSKAPGFVSRHILIALADHAKITTLVVWTSNDIYDAWRASPQRAAFRRINNCGLRKPNRLSVLSAPSIRADGMLRRNKREQSRSPSGQNPPWKRPDWRVSSTPGS